MPRRPPTIQFFSDNVSDKILRPPFKLLTHRFFSLLSTIFRRGIYILLHFFWIRLPFVAFFPAIENGFGEELDVVLREPDTRDRQHGGISILFFFG